LLGFVVPLADKLVAGCEIGGDVFRSEQFLVLFTRNFNAALVSFVHEVLEFGGVSLVLNWGLRWRLDGVCSSCYLIS
jgi:hypothetical protein